FFAAMQFLMNRGLRVPQDVSLLCSGGSPIFEWSEPTVTHIRWDTRPSIRRILRWTANVSLGRQDLRQTLTRAEFVPGGTIGPAQD
ncbi:MAG: substrate-binding domain-containing protein, partial [Verrucomicrobia bacterium]|nr:substrate-binding domain-containing protein [Verrucomicrobiota bacterium]